jgi:tRNA dimethylallyltransferase
VSREDVIAVFGPTGVGKTAVAIALADGLRRHGEDPVAVSADALQIYRGLEVLTGAATKAERQRLEHRLVSFVPVTDTFSAGRYAELAHREIDALLAAGRRPIVVGGTGLYLRAALTELSLRPPPPTGTRERLTAELEAVGPEQLHVRLAELAPWAADTIAPTDRQRIVRALELHEVGQLAPAPGTSELWTSAVRRSTLLVGLEVERQRLYAQIDARAERMAAEGAREEVLRAEAAGASTTARKALGYDELRRGDVAAMQLHTRRYARRQLTWLRKLGGVTHLDITGQDPRDSAEAILALWRGEG